MLPKPASCASCVLFGRGCGYVPADGTGKNGVLLVFEAAGEHEEKEGKPLVGKAGFAFHRMLQRAGLQREDFRIHNVLSCRPPDNKLRGEGYEDQAIEHCAPLLDATITSMQPKVIVAGGDVAFRRLLPDVYNQLKGFSSKKRLGLLDARGYVFWSERYQCWVIPTIHPSFIMRGQTAFESVFIRDVQFATLVAKQGFAYVNTAHFLLDPPPMEAMEWARKFELACAIDPELHLAIDDETPWKDEDEEEIDEEEQHDEVIILRMGYSYGGGKHVLSIPWGGTYEAVHRRLLKTRAPKIAWNKAHDEGDIRALGYELNGTIHDGMIAWHVLHSDLRKKLGFVTPFLIPDMPMWKHLAKTQPAYYNACDAYTEDRDYLLIKQLLVENKLWPVYERHVVLLDVELSAMSQRGMPIDPKRRLAAAILLDGRLKTVRVRMQAAVPEHLKPLQPKRGYVREPADKTGLVQVVIDGVLRKRCEKCGLENPRKDHFSKKTIPGPGSAAGSKLKKDRMANPCFGGSKVEQMEGTTRWAKQLSFTPSPKQILGYMAARKHRPTTVKGKPTTDEKAMKKAIGRYGGDPLYPLILEHRELQKLAGTYIGYVEGSDALVSDRDSDGAAGLGEAA